MPVPPGLTLVPPTEQQRALPQGLTLAPQSSGADALRRSDVISPQEWFAQTYGRPPSAEDQPMQTRWREDPEGMRAWNEVNSRQLEQQYGPGGPGFVPSEAPNLVGDPMSRAEMAGRTVLGGVSLGLADDIARLFGNDQWAMEQERGTEVFRETNPIEAGVLDLAGNAIPAAALGIGALATRTAGGRLAAAATGGAAEGAAAGYGYQPSTTPTGQRIANAIPLAALGAGAGTLGAQAGAGIRPTLAAAPERAVAPIADTSPLAQAVGRNLDVSPPAGTLRANLNEVAETPQEMFTNAAHSLYGDLSEAGLLIAPNSFDNAAERLTLGGTSLADFDSVNRINAKIGALRGQTLEFMDVEELRQFINNELASATNANERRIVGQIRDNLDEYMESLAPGDLLGGGNVSMTPEQAVAAVEQARASWRIAQKLDILDEATQRAMNSATDQTRALQTEMRRIVNNPTLRRNFTAEELDLMRQIAQGQNRSAGARLLARLGSFAPQGLGGILGITSSIATGSMAPLIPLAAGAAARGVAGQQTSNLYNRLYGITANQTPLRAVPSLAQAGTIGAGALATQAPQ